MTDRIRYASGSSSLGDFLVASSDRGLVAFEFGNALESLIAELRERIPESAFEADGEGLADTVSRLADVIEHPALPVDLPLDPRGSEYEHRVWALLREILPGATTSYGALAARLGTRDAREVTQAIMANRLAILIPCHRVLRKDGSISGYRWGVRRKRTLLERERREVTRQAA